MPEDYEHSRGDECSNKKCRAPIFWLNHERTGKPAPIDREPVKGGNITIDPKEGTYRIVPKAERELSPNRKLHMNHFVTCPEREQFGSKK